ncbi:MAG: DUF2252 family protein [Deltaproteobacteria bacterium]|nr:DUF2252 family protein [Deltaproteobacteria bacterium]
MVGARTALLGLCLATLGAGCASTSKGQPLYVAPDGFDFSQNPKLLARILATPHGYFRFINRPFASEVCNRMSPGLADAPVVNLHGDAHLEQYAVTDLGRGLTDFDDSTAGPAALDLVRFSVSLRLAAEANGWTKDAEALIQRFLDGYKEGLENPDVAPSEPTVAARIRGGFTYDRKRYFEWVDSIIQPMPDDLGEELGQAFVPYVESMRAQDPSLPPDFFRVKQVGLLQMGIGSALDMKFLVRVEGKTEAPEDDVVLEVKEVRDLRGVSCITHNAKVDPFRILVGQSRIAYRPYELLGYLQLRGKVFWIHSWVDNYREVKLAESFQRVEELEEVVHDVGVQLGRGHAAQIAAPLGQQLRRALLTMLEANRGEILRLSADMAKETVAAWKRFAEAHQ